MKNNSFLYAILFALLINIPCALALLPPANIGEIPFDHDKFLQFAESNTSDTITSAGAYYQAVDPSNLRGTIAEWKALNGFIEPLPNTTAELAAMGISHALYRNATDLGFVRNIYMRVKANGDVVALLENFAGFERTVNQSFDETNDSCNVPFNIALPQEQRCTSGGIDGFENRDFSGVLASVVMEYSATTVGALKFTRFFGYENNGDRVEALDLTGRGKAEAFPGLCAVCHGGSPASVDDQGAFSPPDLAYAAAADGNFGSGFLPFDPDLYEYHDPLSAGTELGSGIYSRANQEAFFKALNQLVLTTNPTSAARELVEGWYGGSGLPNAFNGEFIPTGWAEGSAEDIAFYETVIGPYCRACHIQRAFPESETNPNAHASTFNLQQGSQLDFNHRNDISWLKNQIGTTVFSRTTMPLALVTYNKFWSDAAAVQSFIEYLPSYIPSDTGTALMPGKPIADPGTYPQHVVNQPLTLDGSGSLSADNFSWSVSPNTGVNLTDATTATPTFTANTAGSYTISLTVSNNASGSRPADTSTVASTTIQVIHSPFSRITFETAIKPSTLNARCLKCHSPPDRAGNENFNLYSEMIGMSELSNFAVVQGDFISRLLYKPAALLADASVSYGVHNGGKVIHENSADYALLKSWIEDGECERDTSCQRLSVTNENTSLEVDPLSPFINKSLYVTLSGIEPVHGTLSITSEQQLFYVPDVDFSGLDTYYYLLTDPQTSVTGLVTEKIYVFPDLNITPANLSSSFASQHPLINTPSAASMFDFEKVNSDGDALPNYLDDFPNNPLISQDSDNDGLPNAFNSNVTSQEILLSGIVLDQDNDNDGVLDTNDSFPLDPLRFIYIDTDSDGIEDAFDPYPLDMHGTLIDNFETGDLSATTWTSWATDGVSTWLAALPPTNQAFNPAIGSFSATTPPLNDNEGAFLNLYTPVAEGIVSFWYFLSSEACCDTLTLYIDGVEHSLNQSNGWERVTFPVTAGSHSFLWAYSKNGSISNGLDAAFIDDFRSIATVDNDADGASNALDNCPVISNTNQNDLDNDGQGDVCDNDSDGDTVVTGSDAFPLDPAASLDSDGDGLPDALVVGVTSTSTPPLTVDLMPFDPHGILDLDGDGVGENAIYTFAGTGSFGSTGDGGLATDAKLTYPYGLAHDTLGNAFITDAANNNIRRVDAVTGIITTIAGIGSAGFSGDGSLATAAELNYPTELEIDNSGNLYIADNNNYRIRRIDAVTGIITTIAGTGSYGSNGDGGLASGAELIPPSSLIFDTSGNLLIGQNTRVRKIDITTGIITTVIGTGSYGSTGDAGLATAATLKDASALAFDNSGNLFISDLAQIRRVDVTTGIITTVAGTGITGTQGDGGLAVKAELNAPQGLAVDNIGNLFIGSGSRIRRVDAATGIISTIAGSALTATVDSGDSGLAKLAKLTYIFSMKFDSSQHLLVSTSATVRLLAILNTPDAFPYDPAASVDTDGDGFPDSFNANASVEQVAATGLVLDAFTTDPSSAFDDNGDSVPDYLLIGSGVDEPLSNVFTVSIPAFGPYTSIMLLILLMSFVVIVFSRRKSLETDE